MVFKKRNIFKKPKIGTTESGRGRTAVNKHFRSVILDFFLLAPSGIFIPMHVVVGPHKQSFLSLLLFFPHVKPPKRWRERIFSQRAHISLSPRRTLCKVWDWVVYKSIMHTTFESLLWLKRLLEK